MQSLRVARFVLSVSAFALALFGSSRSTWSAVTPANPLRNARNPKSNPETSNNVTALTFAPSEYCVQFWNDSRDCRPYTNLLASSGSRPHVISSIDDLEPHSLVPSTPSARLQSATSSWCVAAASPANGGGTWLLYGAQSILCLVALQVCTCTQLLWLLFSGLSVLLSLCALRQWRGCESSVGFTIIAQACLNLLLLLEWWLYSLYVMDVTYLALLQLVTHYGASFWMSTLSLVVSLVACHVCLLLSNPQSPYHLAKLYAMPLSPRSRRRRWSPREADAEALDENAPEVPLDPLNCPANYSV